ncbi:MAG TPA: TIGR00366 family protein, partial [Thermoanaerobaculia bacterium]
FALAAVVIVFALGLGVGESPAALVTAFGDGFWSLIPFTMQMALIIIGGFAVASSRPCTRLIGALASIPRSPRAAVAFVALFAMLSSLLSWGFSLIFTGLLVRELVRRIEGIDLRAIGGAAYLGLGSVWALGFSSSSALMMATKSSIPAGLYPISGVIPLSQTILLWQNGALAAILIVLSVTVAYYSCPDAARAKTATMLGVEFKPMAHEAVESRTPAEKLENTPILTWAVVAMMIVYLGFQIRAKGIIATLDLNNFNFIFLTAALLLHSTPRNFLRAVADSVPATSGVLVQFPFYAGIFGLITKTRLEEILSNFFLAIANENTFNPIVTLYSAILGVFIPSGGGKWVIEAPYLLKAANELEMHLGWVVQTYNAAETLPNLLNPFFMLPLMGILNVKARDIAGYSILQFLFHAPVVLFVCWLLAYTLPYVPPVL